MKFYSFPSREISPKITINEDLLLIYVKYFAM